MKDSISILSFIFYFSLLPGSSSADCIVPIHRTTLPLPPHQPGQTVRPTEDVQFNCTHGFTTRGHRRQFVDTCLLDAWKLNSTCDVQSRCQVVTVAHAHPARLTPGEFVLHNTPVEYACDARWTTLDEQQNFTAVCGDGEWIDLRSCPLVSFCRVETKGNSEPPASMVGQAVNVGSSVTYKCKNKSHVQLSPEMYVREFDVVCGQTGWKHTADCTLATCSPPRLPVNSMYHRAGSSELQTMIRTYGTDLPFGFIIEYQCEVGWKTSDYNVNFNATCWYGNTWKNISDCLTPVTCSIPNYTPNAEVESQTNAIAAGFAKYGSELVYACRDGWMTASGMRQFVTSCGLNGFGRIDYCSKKADCKVLDEPRATPKHIEAGKTVTWSTSVLYNCNDGWTTPIGDDNYLLTCGYSGWISQTTCSNAITCIVPTAPHSESDHVPGISVLYGTEVNYTCDMKWKVPGLGQSFSIKCGINWQILNGCSIMVGCTIASLNHSTVSTPGFGTGDEVSIGITIEHQCEPGFVSTPMTKQISSECTITGWRTTGSCSHTVECTVPPLLNTEPKGMHVSIDSTVLHGTQLSYVCLPGWLTPSSLDNTTFNVTCEDGDWNPAVFRDGCTRKVQCLVPKTLKYATLVGSQLDILDYGQSITVVCDELRLSVSGLKEMEITCDNDNRWKNLEPCVGNITCEVPDLTHAEITSENINIGNVVDNRTVVYWQCQGDWMSPSGKTHFSQECSHIGWLGDDESCTEVIECMVSESEHAALLDVPLYSMVPWKTIITYPCEDGLSATRTRYDYICTEAGWLKEAACLVKTSCVVPDTGHTIRLGMPDEGNILPYKKNLVYQCQLGWMASDGKQTITIECARDNTWMSMGFMKCDKRMKCKIPPMQHTHLAGSYSTGDTVYFGNVVHVTCTAGMTTPSHLSSFSAACGVNGWENLEVCTENVTCDNIDSYGSRRKEQFGKVLEMSCPDDKLSEQGQQSYKMECKSSGWVYLSSCTKVATCEIERRDNTDMDDRIYPGLQGTVRFGTKINYTCSEGWVTTYKRRHFSMTCGYDGWIDSEECSVRIRCAVQSRRHAELIDDVMIGGEIDYLTRITFKCVDGWEIEGGYRQFSVECGYKGLIGLKECSTRVQCELPTPSPQHSFLDMAIAPNTLVDWSTSLHYSCNDGWLTQNGEKSFVIQCGNDGFQQMQTCQRHVVCKIPSLTHATNPTVTAGTLARYGRRIEYACDPGWLSADNNIKFTVQCDYSGWAGYTGCNKQIEFCEVDLQRNTHYEAVLRKNSTVIATSGTAYVPVNEYVRFKCHDGFHWPNKHLKEINHDCKIDGSIQVPEKCSSIFKGEKSLGDTDYVFGLIRDTTKSLNSPEVMTDVFLHVSVSGRSHARSTFDVDVPLDSDGKYKPWALSARVNKSYLASYRSTETIMVNNFLIAQSDRLDESALSLRIVPEHAITVQLVSVEMQSIAVTVLPPVRYLGSEYYIAALRPNSGGNSRWVVVSTDYETEVKVTMPVWKFKQSLLSYNTNNKDELVKLGAGETMTIMMDKYQTIEMGLTESEDGSGVRIETSKRVFVISGVDVTTGRKSYLASVDHVLEVMPPVDSWGQRAFTVPFAGLDSGDIYRIFASESVRVRVSSYNPDADKEDNYYEVLAGRFVELDLSSTSYADIQIVSGPATAGLMVMQYSKSGWFQSDGNGDTAMMFISPPLHWKSEYTVLTPTIYTKPVMSNDDQKSKDGDTSIGDNGAKRNEDDASGKTRETSVPYHYVNIVIQLKHVDGLHMDGFPLLYRNPIQWIVYGDSGYAGSQMMVVAGDHHFYHDTPGVSFGLWLYGFAMNNGYAFAASERFHPSRTCVIAIDTMYSGDVTDNDCDGFVDEEKDDNIDNDGDLRIDEDLATALPMPVTYKPTATTESEPSPTTTETYTRVFLQMVGDIFVSDGSENTAKVESSEAALATALPLILLVLLLLVCLLAYVVYRKREAAKKKKIGAEQTRSSIESDEATE